MSELPALRTVYGTILNFCSEFETWTPKMHEPPYQAPPKAPVLYIKPANTFSHDGAQILVPTQETEVEVGATVGMVMHGPRELAGWLLMNDLSLPQPSYFRPPVRFNALDGFLGIGGTFLRASDPAIDATRFVLEVRVNGALQQTVRFDALIRSPERLLADVSEFMTLAAGDVLMLGLDAHRPRARAGDVVEIRSDQLGRLTQTLVAERE